MMATKISLADARHSVGFSQGKLSRVTEVSLNAISNCERGQKIMYSTAKTLLSAINKEREKAELPQLSIEDISWELR